jgi:hypothetical protein
MAHSLRLANGWQLTAMLSPGRPGRNTLHLIYADAGGAQASVPGDPAVTVKLPSGASRTPPPQRFRQGGLAKGHFIVLDTFPAGRSEFHVVATGGDGSRLDITFPLTIQK